MPLVTAAVIAYVAGLLTGFGEPPVLSAIVVAIIAWQATRTTRDAVAIVAFSVCGLAAATDAAGREERCVRAAAQRQQWAVTLSASAQPGAFARGALECGSVLRMAVATGRAGAGSLVRVRGLATPGRGAPVIEDAAIEVIRGANPVIRWRERLAGELDARFGEYGPLVRTLLLADTRDMPATMRDRFAGAGLSHMLSVSGLHVGIIAAAVALLAQLVGLSRGRRDAVVLVITCAYVAVIGAPIPAVRSAVMLAVYSLGYATQRNTSSWAVLSVGAAVPLVDARAVLDVGYQLSVVGMAALIAAGALNKRAAFLQARGWRGALVRGIATSVIATLLTAPLVAATFGRVSFIAPLSNLVALPIIGVLQPMLFLAAVAVAAGVGAQFVADASTPLRAALDAVATHAETLPGASVPVSMDGVASVLAGAAAVCFVVAAVSRFPGRSLVAGGACLAALAWRPMVGVGSGRTELHLIDVGQGDAIALRSARGRWVLFDAGRDWMGGDEGKRDVIPYISSRDGPLVAFVLSHPHADHVGGAASVLHALRPTYYFDPGYAGGTTPYLASLLEARKDRVAWQRVRPGDSVVVDEAVITFLAPDSAWAEAQRDPNLASAVARIRVGRVSFLLTGDAEAPEERWLVEHERALLRADVLKVAHHGSRTSSTPGFLDAVGARLALVSVGAGNVYHHPSASVLDALVRRGIITLRTDRNGTVIVRTDGRAIEVELDGERWPLRPP